MCTEATEYVNFHTFERDVKYDFLVSTPIPFDNPDPKTALLGSSLGVDVNLSDVQPSDNVLRFSMEDNLGEATEVGLDSLEYSLSQTVFSVKLIVTLDDGSTTYKYDVSISSLY